MYNRTMRPRNLIAKDLRTPKYRMRTVESKVKYIRQPKHRKIDCDIPNSIQNR